MTQADFDFRKDGGGSWAGGDGGAAVLHEPLSSPLEEEGLFGRTFKNSSGGSRTIASIKETVDGGAFFEIPSTQKVSVRAWIRATTVVSSNDAVGICVKLDPDNSGTSNSAIPKGYSLYIGDVTESAKGTNLRLTMDRKTAAHSTVAGLTPVVANTWYKIRMDVEAVSPTEDRIKVFTGVGETGSEIWTLHHTETVLSSDNHYVPWAESGAGKVGFFALHNNTTHQSYIDRFQVFIEEA